MKHIPGKIASAIRRKIDKQAVEEAEKLGQHADGKDIHKVETNLEKMKRGPVAKIWDMVQTLWSAFKSPVVPVETKVMIIGGLLYLINPIDVVPDTFGPAGLLDDAAVIAFIYAQCKDLITKFIPKVTEQIKTGIQEAGEAARGQISRITEETVSDTVGRSFKLFCRRMFFNSLLKLALFTSSMLLLYFSRPGRTAGKYAASVLLLVAAAWFAAALVSNVAAGIRILNKFIPIMRRIDAREKQAGLSKSGYKKLRWQDRAAEALYTAFAEPALPEQQKKWKKVYAFVFRRWNEGKLPPWIPGKRAMVDHVWNSLKFLAFTFIFAFSGYLLAYNLLVKGLLMRTATDYTLLQLLAYPFVYTGSLWK
ncbi:MAG TPA: hypothetical protein DCL73_03715 [Treponema sp.]|nr:hypothetical protein [Treponema sp.]